MNYTRDSQNCHKAIPLTSVGRSKDGPKTVQRQSRDSPETVQRQPWDSRETVQRHQSSIISQLIDCLTLKQGCISQTSLISNYDHDNNRQQQTGGHSCRGLPFGDGLIKQMDQEVYPFSNIPLYTAVSSRLIIWFQKRIYQWANNLSHVFAGPLNPANINKTQQILEIGLRVMKLTIFNMFCRFIISKGIKIGLLVQNLRQFLLIQISPPLATSEILTWLEKVLRFLPDGLRHHTKGQGH